ncbi:MAG TPA: hypothetical protein ENO20_07240 [Bacteroides sp.]|nr:hypothetical protein [Bacteroides sp.]
MKRIALFLLPVVMVLTGCAGTRNIHFNAQVPAPYNIPHHIKSLAIIDRSIPQDEDLNMLEGVLTGEGVRQDRLATQIVLDGLSHSLQNSSRYRVTRTTEKMKGSGAGSTFPEPLDWERVTELCEKYEADALVSLETYDSDFIVTHGAKTGGEGGIRISAQGVATVDCGFRLYDYRNRDITDQFHFSHKERWESGGTTITAAVATLLNKNDAIRDASFQAGIVYGERITPSWVRIHREYFKKSKRDPYLAEGARMMEANDWDRAIAALTTAVETGHFKTKGRAAHNLAVVYEILGNLEEAKIWATDAWGRYGIKRSRDYGYLLTRRINERRLLESQLNE